MVHSLCCGPGVALQVLNLEWCKLRAEGVAHIAAALELNGTLAVLNLSR